MKTTQYTIPRKIYLLLVILLLTACIKDDMDECGTTRVWVKFDTSMYTLPAGEHHIESVHVYMFNEEEQLVHQWQGSSYNYAAGEQYEVPVDLPPGTYRFIAWTNQGEAYKTKQAPRLSDIQLYLEEMKQGIYTEDIPDLHYGTLEKITVDPTQDHEYTLYLIPNTYRINLTVTSLPEGNDEDEYLFSITDNNTRYNFNNRVIENQQPYSHQRTSKFEEDKLNASIRTLTLHGNHAIENIGKEDTGDRSPTLLFKNNTDGTELFTEDMVKIIRTAYATAGRQVDFDETYEFNIILSFDANMNVTISVNGWTYNPNGIEL
ncbi:MAG: FimB/Mfa2 family fimbrial subunit [Tannerellaceae bacterium]|nr:FimB/Mfa2 family fimbrial subunit [Tannerellaceae bacterium]